MGMLPEESPGEATGYLVPASPSRKLQRKQVSHNRYRSLHPNEGYKQQSCADSTLPKEGLATLRRNLAPGSHGTSLEISVYQISLANTQCIGLWFAIPAKL